MPPSPGETPPTIPSQELVNSLPAPIVRLLIIFAGPIRGLKVVIEVLCWGSGRRVESWMLVCGWWAICLGSKYLFKYLTPLLIFLPLLPLSRLSLRRKPSHDNGHSSHQTLLLTLADLHAIHALLPPSPLPKLSDIYTRFSLLGTRRLLRGLIVIWSTWIILGRLIGFNSLLAIIGSLCLLLPSPPLSHLLRLLSRSLMSRRTAALVFLLVFGTPPEQQINLGMGLSFTPWSWARKKWVVSRRPSLAFSFRPAVTAKDAVPDSAIADDASDTAEKDEGDTAPIYFRFEVHENQRWWMGLDWTSALLPQERPSWCDSHLLPVSPPASFALPQSSSIILPATGKSKGTVKGKGKGGGGRIKRTAIWKWADEDWSIVRAGPAAGSSGGLVPIPTSNPNITSPTSPQQPQSPSNHDDEGHLSGGSGYNVNPEKDKRMSFPGFGTSPSNSSLMEDSMTGRAHSIAEQAFTKGLERLKARTSNPSSGSGPSSPKATMGSSGSAANLTATVTSPGRTSGEWQRDNKGRKGSHASDDLKEAEAAQGGVPMPPQETIKEKDEATDVDGWVYGDNKWENMGPKGGLGRFTRRRRWQRRAMLIEIVEHLPPGPGSGSDPDATDDPFSSSSSSSLKAPPAPTVYDAHTASAEVIVNDKAHTVKGEKEAPSPIPELEEVEDVGSEGRPASDHELRDGSGSGGSDGDHETRRGQIGEGQGQGQGQGQGHGKDGTQASSGMSTSTNSTSRDDALRMRLKKAMGNMGA